MAFIHFQKEANMTACGFAWNNNQTRWFGILSTYDCSHTEGLAPTRAAVLRRTQPLHFTGGGAEVIRERDLFVHFVTSLKKPHTIQSYSLAQQRGCIELTFAKLRTIGDLLAHITFLYPQACSSPAGRQYSLLRMKAFCHLYS